MGSPPWWRREGSEADVATTSGAMVYVAAGVAKTTWAAIPNGNQGSPMSAPDYADKSVQVSGTFGAAGSVSIEGSNDGSTWHVLNDSRGEGNAITLTAADTRTIMENPLFIRPNVTAGDGTTALTVSIVGRKVK